MQWKSVKRGALIGAGAGLATVGAATLAPAWGVLALLGACGTCTAWGLGLGGGIGGLGFLFGVATSPSDPEPWKRTLEEAAKNNAKLRAALDEVVQANIALRADLTKWEVYKADAMRVVAVLAAAAFADQDINDTEENCIRNQVFGLAFLGLPDATRDDINRTIKQKISLKVAFDRYSAIELQAYRDLTRPLLEIIMLSDAESGALHQREINFLTAWDVLSGNNSPTAA